MSEKVKKSQAAIIWRNRTETFSPEEIDCLIRIFKLDEKREELRKTFPDDIIYAHQKLSLIEEAIETLTTLGENDRQYFQKQYDDGRLEKWFKNEVNSF